MTSTNTNKINYSLLMRLKSIKDQAEKWASYLMEEPMSKYYKQALAHKVKYARKGWIRYDSANDYDANGNMRLYNLDEYDTEKGTGWYTSDDCYETIDAYAVKIPTSKGLFICPAIAYSDADIATIYVSKGVFQSKDEENGKAYSATLQAINEAERLAERLAADDREYYAQDRAEQEAQDLKESNAEARKEAHEVIKGIKQQRAQGVIVGTVCSVLMEKVKELRGSIRRNNKRISALKANYWLAVA